MSRGTQPSLPRSRRDLSVVGPSWITWAAVITIALKLTLVVLVLDPFGEQVFAVPKAAASRGLAYVLFALTTARLTQDPVLPVSRPVLWSSAAYLLVTTIATVLAVHQYTAVFGASQRFMGLTQVLDGVGLALATSIFVRSIAHVRVVLRVIAGGATLAGAYAIVQAIGLDPISYADRVITSTIGNPGAAGGYALIAAALVGASALTEIPTTGRERLILLAIAALLLAVVVVTGARGPVFAVGIVAITIAVLAGHRWHQEWSPSLGQIAIASASVALLLLLALVSTPTGSRVVTLVTGGDLSTTERSLIYGAAIDAVRQRPVLGVGMDSFVVVYPSVRPVEISAVSGSEVTQTSTHSWFLHQLLGAGIIGLLSAMVLVIAAVAAAWPAARARDSAAIVGIVGLTAFLAQGAFNIVHVVTDTFFWLSIGLMASVSAEKARTHRGRWTTTLAAVAVAVGLIAAATVWSELSANREVRASNFARLAGEFTTAERSAIRATELDPGRPDHWNVLGLALSARAPDRAVSAFRRASDLAPYESRYAINVAKDALRASATDPSFREVALRYSARAVTSDPHTPESHFVRGFVLLQAGEPSEALAEAERAIALRPARVGDALQAEFLASDAAKALGRPEPAAEHLRSALELARSKDHALAPVIRLDLARLLVSLGRADEGRVLVPPPRLLAADRGCDPINGYDEVLGAGKAPRCLHLAFAISELLVSDPGRSDSAVRRENFSIDGEPLPANAQLIVGSTENRDGVPVVQAIEIQLPSTAPPPRDGAVIVVAGVADRLGNKIGQPSTAVVR